MASAYSETETITCETDKSLTFDFSIDDVSALLVDYENLFEVVIPEYKSVMPEKPQLQEKKLKIEITEVTRVLPCR